MASSNINLISIISCGLKLVAYTNTGLKDSDYAPAAKQSLKKERTKCMPKEEIGQDEQENIRQIEQFKADSIRRKVQGQRA